MTRFLPRLSFLIVGDPMVLANYTLSSMIIQYVNLRSSTTQSVTTTNPTNYLNRRLRNPLTDPMDQSIRRTIYQRSTSNASTKGVVAFNSRLHSRRGVMFITTRNFSSTIATILTTHHILIRTSSTNHQRRFIRLNFRFFHATTGRLSVLTTTKEASNEGQLFNVTMVTTRVDYLTVMSRNRVAHITLSSMTTLTTRSRNQGATTIRRGSNLLANYRDLFRRDRRNVKSSTMVTPNRLVPRISSLSDQRQTVTCSFF